jgi:cytidine deaminase
MPDVSSGLTVCAERTAVQKAVSEGERTLLARAVVTEDGATPCGACRQVLFEFEGEAMGIALGRPDGSYREKTLGALLPEAFRREREGPTAGPDGCRSGTQATTVSGGQSAIARPSHLRA